MLGDANAKQEPVSTKLCSPRVTGPSLWGHGRPERSSESTKTATSLRDLSISSGKPQDDGRAMLARRRGDTSGRAGSLRSWHKQARERVYHDAAIAVNSHLIWLKSEHDGCQDAQGCLMATVRCRQEK